MVEDKIKSDPEYAAAMEVARRELNEAWEVKCRYGNCVVFVSPDSNIREDLGGWGPIDCPCKSEEYE
jgi:hypothetical protein